GADSAGLAPLEVGLGFRPRPARGEPSGETSIEVALLEVDAPVASREPGLVGGVAKGRPREREGACRHHARLDIRASRGNLDGGAEPVSAGEQAQDLGAGGTEVAMAGRVLGKRRRREGRRLIWEPRRAVDRTRSPKRTRPRDDSLAAEEIPDGGNRSHRGVRALVVPCADAGVEDRIRQREEELYVEVDPMFLDA